MKRLLCAAVLTALLAGFAFAANAPAGTAPDANGFRSIKWGTPLEKVSGLSGDGEGLSKRIKTFYWRPDDELVLGKIPLDELFYDFFDGRFSGITMTAEPEEQDGMIAFLTRLYGKPQKDGENEDGEPYVWKLRDGGGEVRVIVEASTISLFGGKRTLYRVTWQTPEYYHYMDTAQWLNDQ